MRSGAPLVALTGVGSALCWWPLAMDPNLGFAWFVPLVLIALYTGLSTALCGGCWLWFLLASSIGTFAGLCVSYAIWWPTDPIAGPWVLLGVAVSTLLAALISFAAGLTGRKVAPSGQRILRFLWLALVCCVAFGPVALALTPPIVKSRTRRNDRMAAERFEALTSAVRRTYAGLSDPTRICDGSALKRYSSGSPFADEDWHRITGNYVKKNGYFYMVYCREVDGYTIVAAPAREKGDGTRRFCTDESGRLGCGMEWNRTRHACLPCSK